MIYIDPEYEVRKAWDDINKPVTEEESRQYALSRGRNWEVDAEKIIEDRRLFEESGLSFAIPKPEWKCGAGTLDCLSHRALRFQPDGEWVCSSCRKPILDEHKSKLRILRNLP